MRAWVILTFLFFLILSAPAKAIDTGAELFHACSAAVKQADGFQLSVEDTVSSIYCLGYVSGFTDSVRLTSHFYKPQDPKICLPEKGASNNQLIRVVTKWLKDHPENLHESARMEVMFAFQNTFPCK